ncbi:cation-transporting P-type ATPase [Mumia zhuanghuii]|uniref:cation-transporting P-type ATPase n=1 Tax=Mumia zhuanghuii TaxID=2585211 RepID=UPI00363792E5
MSWEQDFTDIGCIPPAAPETQTPPYVLSADKVVDAAGSDATTGLSVVEAELRLASYGPNEIAAEKPSSS